MKQPLLNHCIQLAQSKVEALDNELNATRDSATSESKSSAGDKHETGRAMMHLEQEKLQKQLAEARNIVAELERIDGGLNHKNVGLGSLITTDKSTFFLAAGLGKVEYGGQTYFVVSTKAPIAAQFIGKTQGEKVNMNGTVYDILSVE